MMKTMIRKYMAWFAALLLGMATLPSCEKESFNVTFEEAASNTLSLKLFCSENNSSRSTDDTNNEDAIHRLDIFLYPENATFDTQAVFHKTIEGISSNASHTESLSLTNDQIDALFGASGTSCKIYAIANRPDATALTNGKTSVNQLKALTITATFNSFQTDDDENKTSVYQPQADFVMDSDFIIDGNNDKITLNRDNHTLSGTVPLFRAASKISLIIDEVKSVPLTDADGNVQKDEQGNDIIWTANTSGMLVRLHDGVSKSHIDNSVQPYDVQEKTETQEGDYFNFAKGQEVKMTPVESDWKNIPAFYSYSSDWSAGADEEPYLTLIVPWKRSDATTEYYQPTYYQVPISTIAQKLERNTHYKITLTVSRLGSFVEEVPEAIAPSSYIIVPWQSETVDADLMDYRYLMVEEKDITIYNEEELYIPYVTSHEAEIVDITCEQMDLSLQIPDWKDANYDKLNLTQKEGYIYFKNTLDNNYKSNTFDFSEYKITFKIRHSDNEGKDKYYETVTITQYPAIYGKAEMNSDWTTTGTDNQKHDNGGYLFVNGHNDDISATPTPNNATVFCTTPGMGGNDVLNWASPNMYVFTVSSVEGTDYVIGDPRDATYTYDGTDKKWNSNDNVVWAKGPVLHNGTVYSSNSNNVVAPRTIMYYYGTEKSDRTINMIAPKFRIASGYAVLQTGANDSRYLEALKMRCASYQEDGYPAGRWRLPTKAEFEFIITQTNKGRLPNIYKDGSTYWCAHGPGTISGTNVSVNENVTSITGNNNGYSARCVYDEWYWTDKLETETQKKVFTWGDQPR